LKKKINETCFIGPVLKWLHANRSEIESRATSVMDGAAGNASDYGYG